MKSIKLLPDEIKKTCDRLSSRIQKRFPHASLLKTCNNLLKIVNDVQPTVQWINKPNYFIRILSWSLILILASSIIKAWLALKINWSGMNVADFFQMIDAGFNSIVLLGAAGIFLSTSEIKRKRKRVVNAINKLRCIAHIVDAHQLTKDPHQMSEHHISESQLAPYELGRYLDYCSEMLSLASKVAFLYVQDFDDPIANESANELEILTATLSQKIWQKINILTIGTKYD
jgi:hypothetical protein